MSRILLIDDDRHMRSVCERILTKAGHGVACAENGNEGLAILRNNSDPFDIVLLDDLMPGMNGMDVLEQIKIIDPALPVIIVTGSATEEMTKELVAKGARDCLPKPFNPEQLRKIVDSR